MFRMSTYLGLRCSESQCQSRPAQKVGFINKSSSDRIIHLIYRGVKRVGLGSKPSGHIWACSPILCLMWCQSLQWGQIPFCKWTTNETWYLSWSLPTLKMSTFLLSMSMKRSQYKSFKIKQTDGFMYLYEHRIFSLESKQGQTCMECHLVHTEETRESSMRQIAYPSLKVKEQWKSAQDKSAVRHETWKSDKQKKIGNN